MSNLYIRGTELNYTDITGSIYSIIGGATNKQILISGYVGVFSGSLFYGDAFGVTREIVGTSQGAGGSSNVSISVFGSKLQWTFNGVSYGALDYSLVIQSGSSLYPNQPAGLTTIVQWNADVIPNQSNMITGNGSQAASPNTLEAIVSGASLPIVFPTGVGKGFKHTIEAGTQPGFDQSGSHFAGFTAWDFVGHCTTPGDGQLIPFGPGPAGNEYSTYYRSIWFSYYGNGTTFETPPPGVKFGYEGVTNNNQNGDGPGPTEVYWLLAPVNPNTGSSPWTVTNFSLGFATQNGGTSTNRPQNLNTTKYVIVGGVHQFEFVLTLGTAGNADGTVNWWLDGVHIGTYTDLPLINSAFSSSGGNGLSGFWGWNFQPVWGGQGGSPKTRDDVIYLGPTYASGIFLRSHT